MLFLLTVCSLYTTPSSIRQRSPVVPDPPPDDSDLLPSNANDMKFTKTQEFVAEYFGIMILILFGDGVVAMVVPFGKNIPGEAGG